MQQCLGWPRLCDLGPRSWWISERDWLQDFTADCGRFGGKQ
jgi:hypothetical protein